MPGGTPRNAPLDRDAAIDVIQRELTAFARRARAQAGRLHPQLSLVTYAILDHLRETGGCRGTDLATHFMLDKSTVSRQITALERLGLIERSADPDDQRGQIIRASEAGHQLLESVAAARRTAFRQRLDGWDTADLDRFAAYLARYNQDAATPQREAS